jgi:hypothetical protein
MKKFLSLSAGAILLIASATPMFAESGVSSSTPGHKMQSKYQDPHKRGTHQGASSFTPGHKMQSKYQDPHKRGMARGASQYAPGNPR